MARIKLRRDTEANWASVNPVLDLGEPGYEYDTNKIKYGDGVLNWNDLPYFSGGFDGGVITGPLEITADLTPAQGSLILSGDIPEPGDTPTSIGLLQVGPGLNFDDTGIMASFVHNTNSYAQVVVENNSNDDTASSDFIVGNDVGGTVYGDFGINSSGFSGAGIFDSPSSVYLYSAGSELSIGTLNPYTLTLGTNSTSRIEIANDGEVEFQSSSRVHILNTTDSTAFGTGALVVEGGIAIGKTIVADDNLYLGAGAVDVPLTNPVIVVKQTRIGFIQSALINGNDDGSADFVAYTDASTENNGFADMGFTGATFSDPLYTLTPSGSGYIFVQGLNNVDSTGSLYFATGDTGIDKDIVFATGGYGTANEKMRLSDADEQFHVQMSTASTDATTGALVVDGGVGVGGDLNVGGAVNVAGTINGLSPYYHVPGTNYVLSDADSIVTVDPQGIARTVTLPANAPQGKVYTIKRVGLGGPSVTVASTTIACTIDGGPSVILNNYESVTVVMGTDGVNNVYYIIGAV